MNKEEFLKLYKGKAVHCDTEEKSNEFLKLCDNFDIKLVYGIPEFNYWDIYKKDTCYVISIDNKFLYSDIDFLKQNKWEIIKMSEKLVDKGEKDE